MGNQYCLTHPHHQSTPTPLPQLEIPAQVEELLWRFREKHMDGKNNLPIRNVNDGALYRGELVNGGKVGYGEYYCGKQIYVGFFHADLPHGSGILVKNFTDYYHGHFQAGRPHGQGKQKLSTSFFEGRYEFGHRVEGTLKTQSFTYSGFFLNNKFEGQGRIEFQSGESYQGMFRKGKYHGHGTFHHHNQLYVGQFKDGEYSGKGKYYWECGSQFEGQYNRNKRTGYGTFKKKAIEWKGQWKDGQQQTKCQEQEQQI